MADNQVGCQLDSAAKPSVDGLEKADKLLQGLERGLSHEMEHFVFRVFRRYPKKAACVMDHDLLKEGGMLQQKVKADPGTHKDFLHALDLSALPEKVQKGAP